MQEIKSPPVLTEEETEAVAGGGILHAFVAAAAIDLGVVVTPGIAVPFIANGGATAVINTALAANNL